jgi:hypothetical protein
MERIKHNFEENHYSTNDDDITCIEDNIENYTSIELSKNQKKLFSKFSNEGLYFIPFLINF